MARALECPACGMRHRLDGLVPETTFRCERCGQKLLVPAHTPTPAPAPARPPAADTAPVPPRRRTAPVSATRTAAPAAASVTVTLPAAGDAAPSGVPPSDTDDDTPAPRSKRRVAWYWRLLAWIVAVPLGFLLAVVPSYEFGLITKDDVLDVFVGSGTDRYLRLGLVTLIWAVVTALLVQLLVEGGRWWANRRRARAAARPGVEPGSRPRAVPS